MTLLTQALKKKLPAFGSSLKDKDPLVYAVFGKDEEPGYCVLDGAMGEDGEYRNDHDKDDSPASLVLDVKTGEYELTFISGKTTAGNVRLGDEVDLDWPDLRGDEAHRYAEAANAFLEKAIQALKDTHDADLVEETMTYEPFDGKDFVELNRIFRLKSRQMTASNG